jgi:hypothetical protein
LSCHTGTTPNLSTTLDHRRTGYLSGTLYNPLILDPGVTSNPSIVTHHSRAGYLGAATDARGVKYPSGVYNTGTVDNASTVKEVKPPSVGENPVLDR